MTEEEKDMRLQLFVKDQVRSQFDERWTAKRTLVVDTAKIGLSIITVIIAALGVQQYLTIEDMKKKQKEVEELKANIEKEVNAAKALTSSANTDLKSMSKLINEAQNLAEKTSRLALDNSEQVFNSQAVLLEMQRKLYDAATTASNAALQIVGKTSEVNEAIKNVGIAETTATQAKNRADEAVKEAQTAATAARFAAQDAGRLVKKTEYANELAQSFTGNLLYTDRQIKNLKEVNRNLSIIQASQIFVLKKGQSTTVVLYYPNIEGELIRYNFSFKLNNIIQKMAKLEWAAQEGIKKEAEKGSISFTKYPKNEELQKQTHRLGNTPLVLELEHLNAAKLAPDFVIFRIRPI